MKFAIRILKCFAYMLLVPVSYLLIALLLSIIPIDRKNTDQVFDRTIFLSTNGIHTDVILSKADMDSSLFLGLKVEPSDQYLAFGWGDENFYLNTPTWGDLTFRTAFVALFLKSPSLIHVTRYKTLSANWIEIKISKAELTKLNAYLLESFEYDEDGRKIILADQGYTSMDDFYKAKGSFSCFKTCNTWLNTGLKKSGLKSCVWTPFNFGILSKYK
jgi:uncharacterized protein (TIGR02117 family)